MTSHPPRDVTLLSHNCDVMCSPACFSENIISEQSITETQQSVERAPVSRSKEKNRTNSTERTSRKSNQNSARRSSDSSSVLVVMATQNARNSKIPKQRTRSASDKPPRAPSRQRTVVMSEQYDVKCDYLLLRCDQ